jgi:hypothetical protein
MPGGEFKHRYWFFADTPNTAWTVTWKDLLWRADLYRGGCTLYTGFAEQFYAYHRMKPICLKISARIAERETYRMILLKTRLFSHWSIPLIWIWHPFTGQHYQIVEFTGAYYTLFSTCISGSRQLNSVARPAGLILSASPGLGTSVAFRPMTAMSTTKHLCESYLNYIFFSSSIKLMYER